MVEIDSTGTTDTFRWSKDGGQTFVNERVDITASTALALSHGLEITFAAQTGHGLGDRWSFTGRPANVIVTIAENGGEVQRTRDALVSAINDQHDLGLLSMRAATDGTTDSISLTHTMDRWINHQVVVSGTSLTTINLLEDLDHVIRKRVIAGIGNLPIWCNLESSGTRYLPYLCSCPGYDQWKPGDELSNHSIFHHRNRSCSGD